MKEYKRIDRLLSLLNKVYEKLSMIALIGVTVIIGMQIFLRNFLEVNFSWTGELAIYMNIWLVFLGSAIVFKESEHVKMDFFMDKFNSKINRIVNIFNKIITIAFFIVFLYSAFTIIGNIDAKTPALGLPYVYFFAPAIIAFLFMVIIAVVELLKLFNGETREHE